MYKTTIEKRKRNPGNEVKVVATLLIIMKAIISSKLTLKMSTSKHLYQL